MRYRTALATILVSYFVITPMLGAVEVNSNSYTFGVVPQQSIRKVAQTWLPVTQYLQRVTGFQIHFVTAKNIPTFAKNVAEGGYDFAYMNPQHYTSSSRGVGYKAFAMARDKKIKGVIVVRKDSKITSLSELQDRTLAFPSRRAFGATILPHASLLKRNIKINSEYVSSHDSVYRNVVQGNYRAGGGVLRTFYTTDKSVRDQLRILHVTEGYTPHAFASHPDVPVEVVKKIQQALIAMEDDAEARTILKRLNIKGIKLAVDSDWDDVRALKLAD